MLSMNSSTSWPCTSRKYSAMVSADSATRSRVPGGSSIWPKTSAVCPSTPDSSISTIRSLPSRVRSPTPANTETPPWSLATRAIISWISTVLPTPAPRSEEHTSELQSLRHLVCRLLLEKKKKENQKLKKKQTKTKNQN